MSIMVKIRDFIKENEILTVLDERKPERQRLFVDMDGTLAVFTPVATLETLYEKGYFLNLEPQKNVVQAVRTIISEKPEIEVFILSAYLSDSTYALQEKNAWLDYHLPEIDKEHRVFTPCGSDKKLAIKGGIRSDDYLLDDYTLNLNDWEPPAKGIKLLNGINHTKGTWSKNRIRWDRQPQELADMIVSVMQGKIQIYDNNRNDRIPNQSPKARARYIYTEKAEKLAKELGLEERKAGTIAMLGNKPLEGGDTAEAWKKKGYVVENKVLGVEIPQPTKPEVRRGRSR